MSSSLPRLTHWTTPFPQYCLSFLTLLPDLLTTCCRLPLPDAPPLPTAYIRDSHPGIDCPLQGTLDNVWRQLRHTWGWLSAPGTSGVEAKDASKDPTIRRQPSATIIYSTISPMQWLRNSGLTAAVSWCLLLDPLFLSLIYSLWVISLVFGSSHLLPRKISISSF